MAAACAALTGRTTLPGTPMTRLPAGTCMFSGTSAPAAIRQPSPMTAPFKIVACIPIRQPSPTVQPCTTAPCPTDVPRPTVTSSPGPVCSTALSCTLEFSPMAMRPVSARSTAPYQTLLFFSSRTLPASVAFSATNAAPLSAGAWWFIVMKAILLHLRSFRAFPHVVGVGVLDDPGRSRPPSGSAGKHCSPLRIYYNAPKQNCKHPAKCATIFP